MKEESPFDQIQAASRRLDANVEFISRVVLRQCVVQDEAAHNFVKKNQGRIRRWLKEIEQAMDKTSCLAAEDRARKMAEKVDQLIDENIIRKKPPACLACNFGHCCYNMPINLTKDEGALIRVVVGDKSDVERDRIRKRLHANPSETGTQGSVCALLENGRCSIYENRPISCRTYHSTSKAVMLSCSWCTL